MSLFLPWNVQTWKPDVFRRFCKIQMYCFQRGALNDFDNGFISNAEQ